MKTITTTLVAAALFAAPLAAPAQTAGDVAGTWECRLPGVDYDGKPPILYLGAAEARNAGQQTVLDVDGFARTVNGLGDVTADAGGWWKIVPAEGAERSGVRQLGCVRAKNAIHARDRGVRRCHLCEVATATADGTLHQSCRRRSIVDQHAPSAACHEREQGGQLALGDRADRTAADDQRIDA